MEYNKELIKGIITRSMLYALLHSKEIKDKEQFISDFEEVLDLI